MRRILSVPLATLALAGCGRGQNVDPSQQMGPNPVLPDPSISLLPGMNLPKVIPWKNGEAPRVPPGFHIQALATDLASARTVLPLPNGDILVVQGLKNESEPVERPKGPFFDVMMASAHKSSEVGPTNRITLLRDANGDGRAELKSVLLDNLNAPFGIALVGGDLYVAQTEKITRYPFTPGQTRITVPGVKVVDLPAGLINHHWTKALTANADGSSHRLRRQRRQGAGPTRGRRRRSHRRAHHRRRRRECGLASQPCRRERKTGGDDLRS